MSESGDSVEDFPERMKQRDAVEAARQRAIAPSQRPRSRPKSKSMGGYAGQALSNECETVRTTLKGRRQTVLNTACFNIGQLVQPGGLSFDEAKSALTDAALFAGLKRSELTAWDLPDRGLRDGMTKLRNLDEIASAAPTITRSTTKSSAQQRRDTDGDWDSESDDDDRKITWIRASSVKTRVPQWVWEYDGVGRIQLGTVSMFAGKPAAGKSTATRWFASRLSRGELPGIWEGVPMTVAMVSTAEEQIDATIAPSLQVADANMERILLPRFMEAGNESMFASIRDEQMFTEGLIDNEVRAVFIDPVMSTFGGKADVYRNNEVREYLQPFVRIAQAINGIVICVHHLRKGTVQDVLGSMNGSSAFGEVPRGVFGFAPFEAGAHVMEQVKNSAGPNGLKLEYHLPIEYGTADDGLPYELPRFEIKAQTTVSISDIDEARDELTGIAFASEWLTDYLMENQPMPVWQIQKDAKAAGAINNDKMLSRAKSRIGVVSKSQPVQDKPNQHVWMLPEFAASYGKWKGSA